MQTISNVFKFILGFLLAIAILIGSGAAVALYFMNRSLIPPDKPIFANDSPSLQNQSPQATEVKATPETTPTPTPTATPEPTEKLPPGAYRGTVTWPAGLSVRAEPSVEANSIGGVPVNEELIVLENSQDQNWQKIRTQSGQEGWVKINNIQRIE
ncbi:SH3 domain-containing protein [Nodularia harveyana UHCC-0300]|uniref:SH3 domain-containing protein n=1 Tax=Nodularia harveyana UHCC-0300 TaxID=2974287 RepID=A0ABU5UEW6_9CYAN|nr:SH3 domain-containing protein [Nodularia harveyana]MEA5581908.1 SH3 domain-containing protein [Nodularia harveyana UHCC-0300]